MNFTLGRIGPFAGLTSVVVGVLLVACSGATDAVSVSPESACNDVANAICDKIQSCAPFLATILYVDHDACITRSKINCVSSFSATGTSATPLRAAQCARDAKGASCDDLLGRTPPETCRTLSGTLADGAVCGHDAQCNGKLCRIAGGSSCGACSALGAAGAACERDDECDYGLACEGKKCLSRGAVGAVCSDTQPCRSLLACSNGFCALPLANGAACTYKAGENPCGAASGFYCHPTKNLCTALGTAVAGGQCELSLATVTVCTGGAECKRDGAKTTGTCAAPAADGAPCNDTDGPKCTAPARCTGGVCTITDPATCK